MYLEDQGTGTALNPSDFMMMNAAYSPQKDLQCFENFHFP